MTETDLHPELRPLLFSIAYRMLGSVSEAEDIVQEAFLRYHRAQPTEVENPKAYLSAVTTRLAIDHLRSARARREEYVGPWLPEPLLTDEGAGDPSAHAELADSLSLAFLVLLERLSPGRARRLPAARGVRLSLRRDRRGDRQERGQRAPARQPARGATSTPSARASRSIARRTRS